MSEFSTPAKVKPNQDRITIPASPFLNRLGYGTGVSVMQLVRSPCAGQMRSPWALKMLNKQVRGPKLAIKKRIEKEAEILKKMSHPNIVGFRAFDKTKVLYLGMESCDGSLGDMIEERMEAGSPPYEPSKILKVAIDIGNALDYCHTKMKILHGDMKSFNILVNGDFQVCKLCDFGVTLPLDDAGLFDNKKAAKGETYTGTNLWSAPEVLDGGPISAKADIFPFGLVFWEMMALMPPHSPPLQDSDASVVCLDDSLTDMEFAYGTRPEIPADISPAEYEHPLALFYCCTEHIPQMRPSALHVVLCAEDMLLKMKTDQ